MKSLLFTLLAATVTGHGHVTYPLTSRQGGSVELGGLCKNGACYWFSENVEIPGQITLPNEMRSVNINVTSLPEDVYATSPWRAPGTAPVYGLGCGAAGGGPTYFRNGGNPPKGIKQGSDGLSMPKMGAPHVWSKGAEVEVAWAISANHGGGYAWRLCKADTTNITEACFQATPLKFGEQSWILYSNGSKSAPFPITKTAIGTWPPGSEWARNPVPGCNDCDPYSKCGAPLPPVPGNVESSWDEQMHCYAMCEGSSSSKTLGYCPGKTQFAEPLLGISGHGALGTVHSRYAWAWSVLDTVHVPSDIPAGEYLLSWRWDCEETTQVFQNCADVKIVDKELEEA